jgi:hypothetical protein
LSIPSLTDLGSHPVFFRKTFRFSLYPKIVVGKRSHARSYELSHCSATKRNNPWFVIPARDEVASLDVQLHIRESIITIESMDSGQPRSLSSDAVRATRRRLPEMTQAWIASA